MLVKNMIWQDHVCQTMFVKTMFVHVYQDHVNLIQFDPVWSNLSNSIQFDPFWSNLILFDPTRSILIQIVIN